MVYTQIPIARGRPRHRSRVSIHKDSDRAIAISLTSDLAQYIGIDVSGRLKIELGSGDHHGTLRLSAAAVNEQNCVAASRRNGGGVYMRICRDFLPDVMMPQHAITLPHTLERDSIIVDITPLRSNP